MVRNSQAKERSLKYGMDTLMSYFISYKVAQGAAERTLRDYSISFDGFKKVYNHEWLDMEVLKVKLLEFFKEKSSKAPATFNKPYANLNCFFEWCIRNEYLEANPIKKIGLKKKKDDGKVRHVEEDAIKKLIECPDLTLYSGLRDYAMIVLTLDTGIRPSEAFSLRISDIDFSFNTVRIRRETAKTRVERVLPISPQTTEILRRLISVKPGDWDDFLFYTVDGTVMNSTRWQKRLKQYSKKIGYKITPYMLRHTFAILFLRNGGNAFALQTELGHTDLTMTKRYIRLADNDIRKQHTAASPVNNFIKRTTRVQKLFKDR